MCYPDRGIGDGGAIGDHEIRLWDTVRSYPHHLMRELYLVFWTPVVFGFTSECWFYLGMLAMALTSSLPNPGDCFGWLYPFRNEDELPIATYAFVMIALESCNIVSDPADFWKGFAYKFIRKVDSDLIRFQLPA